MGAFMGAARLKCVPESPLGVGAVWAVDVTMEVGLCPWTSGHREMVSGQPGPRESLW